MIHARQSARREEAAQGRPRSASSRRLGAHGSALAVLALMGAWGCGDDGVKPVPVHFGQLGRIEIRLDLPLRLGAGYLSQTLTWEASGEWSLSERISYGDLVGDDTSWRHTGDPAQNAVAYASVIEQLNVAQGIRIFLAELSQDLDPDCGATQTRIAFTIVDDARHESAAWIRCVNGSLGSLSTTGAGPDPAYASRIPFAALMVRDATLGKSWVSAYSGSVPFGTLDRGQDSGVSLGAPRTITTDQGWREFWQSHAPGRALPAVDFGRDMVVVGMVGRRDEAGDSVEVRRVLQVEDGTQIEVFERQPGNFCSPAARSHVPFHVVVSPVTPAPHRFADTRRELVSCGG